MYEAENAFIDSLITDINHLKDENERLTKQLENAVVRCKDCKHYNTIGCSKGFGWCEKIERGISDNFYCANGKQLNRI